MPKKKLKMHHKIFIGLFLGIVVGYILNFIGGEKNPFVLNHAIPFLQFLGDVFIRLIRMIVVPLVFFSIIEGVLSLGDVRKLRNIGLKTVVFFLGSAMIAVTIGLILANIIQPGQGFQLGEAVGEIQVKELPGLYQTILDLIPLNPFDALSTGNMMQIIVFAIFMGIAMLMIGPSAEPAMKLNSILAQAMFKVIQMIIVIIPFGVFGLMGAAIAKFGTAIFGPVAKFIFVDYLANLVMLVVVYSIFLRFIAKVNPIYFWKQAFEPFLIAFSTCTTSAALPVSMSIAPRLGVPKEISNFVLPLGATANMNGTCIYFGIIVIFAAQLYGLSLSISQQIMLALTATFLSVGCAATPQIGLVISFTLLTSMGLPLEATALVAGIYRIIDQIHTATNATGDLVTSLCVASMEGQLDRDVFYDLSETPALRQSAREQLYEQDEE